MLFEKMLEIIKRKSSIPMSDESFDEIEKAYDMAIEILEKSGWIPVKTRKMTAEEIEELSKTNDIIDADDIDQWCYCCKLPDDQQDVLITTEYGDIRFTTFYVDEYYGCYFENYEDRDEVLAWMPLPKPYNTKEEQDVQS